MGSYLNPSNEGFAKSLLSEIYVDKSDIIAYTNNVLRTEQKYVYTSCPRRFGKTMTTDMLTAYYSRGCDSKDMFANLKIAKETSFEEHLNKYNVIFLNMQEFLNESSSIEDLIEKITDKINKDVLKEYPNFDFTYNDHLSDTFNTLFEITDIPIVFIIDEWDCVCREYQTDRQSLMVYSDFLTLLLKDRYYAALVYMTGILPIKKFGTQSGLNMFDEFSMTWPVGLTDFAGFTQAEVISLCEKYKMDYEEMAAWYGGYCVSDMESAFNPKSVVMAILKKQFSNYWGQTETYEDLKIYIGKNIDGLKDAVIELLSGKRKHIFINTFVNDMVTLKWWEDVLILLAHLGYLGYDNMTNEVFIPNKEIYDEFRVAIRELGWDEITS
ncbi:MAG: AAA family ATPase [Oscillospiraceae bacterium]|nr:AAA family ATPase [Oscillospiraceae bacterium]